MADRPIPFTRAMALASWEGRKTQTRRILNPQPTIDFMGNLCVGNWNYGQTTSGDPCWRNEAFQHRHVKYAVGDCLWVREPYWQHGHWELLPGPKTKGGKPKWGFVPTRCEAPVFDQPREFRRGLRHDGKEAEPCWYARLARFMPREYSRQTGIVTKVRVQRVQDISEEDALCEGFTALSKGDSNIVKYGLADLDGWPGNDDIGWHWCDWRLTPVAAYERLWGLINGPDSWKRNPWVVAVTYETIKSNIEALPK